MDPGFKVEGRDGRCGGCLTSFSRSATLYDAMTRSSDDPAAADRRALRAAIRRTRRALPPAEQARHADLCTHLLIGLSVFRNARRIAVYLPADGEIDTAPLIARARALGKMLYLPVLLPHGAGRLWFARYAADEALVDNRFGIPEPAHAVHTRISPLALDLVLTPLVAFDPQGHRLGMGGGFYDRSFAYLLRHTHWRRPRLIGLAHDFQCRPQLPHQPWDVPLHAVVTEKRVYACAQQSRHD